MSDTLTITLNGEPRELPAGSTVADLVATLGLAAGRYAVEVDRQIVPRSTHDRRRLQPGEAVEIVTFVGGG